MNFIQFYRLLFCMKKNRPDLPRDEVRKMNYMVTPFLWFIRLPVFILVSFRQPVMIFPMLKHVCDVIHFLTLP